MKILLVCLGNICRSPLAEGILQSKANNAGLNWTIDSAGTGGYHVGSAPHPLSQKVALYNGIDIASQKCRQFIADDMDLFDRIYVMDMENYQDVKKISGKKWQPEKTDLLMNLVSPGKNNPVPDPYSGTEPDYHTVFNLIAKACDKMIANYLAQQKH